MTLDNDLNSARGEALGAAAASAAIPVRRLAYGPTDIVTEAKIACPHTYDY